MRNHTLNLFRINNLHELNFSYKLLSFDLPFNAGQEDRYNKQLNKIVLQVSSVTGGPAAIIKHNSKLRIAIPADRELEEITVNVVPHYIKVSVENQTHEVSGANFTNDEADVIEKFLDFEIRHQLSKHKSLWKMNSSQFFSKTPVRLQEGSYINIFEGFKYKLLRLGNAFSICLDLNTKYLDKNFLSHYINTVNSTAIGNSYRGKKFLYLNGDNWYAIELDGFGRSIQNHEFDDNGESIDVYTYILNRAGSRIADVKRFVKPNDVTILYKYPGRTMEPHSGAASLARMIYSPQDKDVKALHGYSIKEPNKRFEAIKGYIQQYFQAITFNGIGVKISNKPLIEQIASFDMPDLKYNGNQFLKPGHYSKGGNTSLSDFAQERKRFLLNYGALNKSSFDEQYLLVPDNMDRKLVEAFQRNAEQQIKNLAPAFGNFKVIRYPAKTNQSATFQIQAIESILQKQQTLKGFALVILPDLTSESERYIKSFHDCLKNKFYPDLKVQCASAYKINSYFRQFPNGNAAGLQEYRVPEDKKPRFRSYLLYLVLEYLIVNRKWPYALAKNQHYDIYVGVDVHDRYAGFTFFFKNGEQIFFIPEQVPLKNRAQRSEKLKASLLVKVIYNALKMMIPDFCPNPNGIIIIRDGRSFGEEGKALSSIINSLAADGLVNASTITSGIIDLHKQSAVPLRIASHTSGHTLLENPRSGAFKPVGETECFLFNTGFPFQIRGSAKPLHISKREGNVDFQKVVEDLFHQSMLSFSAPDRSNSLPAIIKLIDALLEPLSAISQMVEENEYEDSTIDNY